MKFPALQNILFYVLSHNSLVADVNFDITHYPFSHYGSYMSIMLEENPRTEEVGLYIRDVSGERMWGWKGVFRLEMLNDSGEVVPMKVLGTPSKLTITSDAGVMEVAYEDPDILRLRGEGGQMRLTQTIATWSGATYPIQEDRRVWHCKMWGPHYIVAINIGDSDGQVQSTYVNEPVGEDSLFVLHVSPDSNGVFEIAIHQVQDAWDGSTYAKPFAQCVEDARDHFEAFQSKIPSTPVRYDDIRRIGAYLKWSSVVNPRTAIKRACMYQSKNYMTAIWSWDNCFGAMSVANDHQFALDQMLVLFDHQTELGILPDFLTDKYPMYAAFKPPVYGLTMQKLDDLSASTIAPEWIETIYDPIAKLTDFWMIYMDNNGNGVPQYNNSNDCCDNSAIFLAGYPTESPDLSTHLIIQMDWLSHAAHVLNRSEASKQWKERADLLTDRLIEHLWDGDRFVAKNTFTRETCGDCLSFMSYIPIMLGDRLPEDIRRTMLHDLRTSGIVTPFGPASEHPDSPYFIDDGYWRGPVWAPHYLFLVEGLKRSGEMEWARELALNYAEMCRSFGFPENFSSLDGRPLSDMGYSWTVDVFFALAHEYLD